MTQTSLDHGGKYPEWKGQLKHTGLVRIIRRIEQAEHERDKSENAQRLNHAFALARARVKRVCERGEQR